jgi:hypothetical protein
MRNEVCLNQRRPSPETQTLIDSVRAEMATPEGKKKLLDALKLAEEASARFREAARVDPASLREIYGA